MKVDASGNHSSSSCFAMRRRCVGGDLILSLNVRDKKGLSHSMYGTVSSRVAGGRMIHSEFVETLVILLWRENSTDICLFRHALSTIFETEIFCFVGAPDLASGNVKWRSPHAFENEESLLSF